MKVTSKTIFGSGTNRDIMLLFDDGEAVGLTLQEAIETRGIIDSFIESEKQRTQQKIAAALEDLADLAYKGIRL